MNKINFTDYPSTTTPISANNLNALQTNIEDEFTAKMQDVGTALDEKVSTSVANSTYEKKGVLLWTNSSPTSSFSAQTITLNDSLSNYDCYTIMHRQSTTNGRIISTGKIPVGHGTFMANPLSTNQYRGTNENTSGSSITFTPGYKANADGSFAEDNTLVIPMYVIGYKTGLF